MITASWRGLDKAYRNLIRIERNVDETSDSFLDFMATYIVSDIRSSWSSPAPSTKGNPPAVWTGNLDSAISIEEQGRGIGGRFAGKGAKFKYIRVDTRQGDNPLGRGEYSTILEKLLDRPFLEPAIERASKIYSEMAQRTIRL